MLSCCCSVPDNLYDTRDMPMDYDDNDTSRHNLQLVGESRTRSSSALRPYDFPKFDFDDSLQGHLRFDSLVETEVFLGIQSQEDNQWIEDFSRGSNGMEFNPTPADSCSISRRDNVWSEATSSESVEMLLKSVGQEEMMPGASITPESDAVDDQGTPVKHVKTSSKPTERSHAYVANSDTTLPPDEVFKDYPASSNHMNEHVETSYNLTERSDAYVPNSGTTLLPDEGHKDYPASSNRLEEQLENPIATHAKDESLHCSDVNGSPLYGNVEMLTNEGNQSYHDECAGLNLEESKISAEKTTNSVAGGDSLGFSSIIDNVNSNTEMLSTSKASYQNKSNFSHEICNNDGQDKHVSTQTVLEVAAFLDGKTVITSSSPSLTSASERHTQEPNLDSVGVSKDTLVKGESAGISVEGEIKLLASEEDDKSTSCTTSNQTSRHGKALVLCNEMDAPVGAAQGGSALVGVTAHSVELASISSGHCASTEQMIDPVVELPQQQDNDNMEDASASPLKYESTSEMPLPSLEDKEVHKQTKIIEGCCDDSMVTEEKSSANLLAHDMNVSIQVVQENIVQRKADFSECGKDICKTIEVDKQAAGDLGDKASENIGTPKEDLIMQSSEIGDRVEVEDCTHKVQPQTSGEPESAALDDHLELEPAAVESFQSDEDRVEAGMKEIHDTYIGAEGDNASKVEVNVADDTVQIPLSEMSANSQQPVEQFDEVCSSVPLSVEAVGSLYSDYPLVHSGANQSSLKDGAVADLITGENPEKVMTKEEEKESAQTADIDKASCGSPTIISSSEPSLTEKDYQEEGKDHEVTHEFIKDIQSTSEDPKTKDSLGDDSSFTFKVNALPVKTDGEPGKNWSPFPDVEKCKVVEESAPSGKGKTERTPSHKSPRQNARVSDGETGSGTSKGTSERKGRRGSAKGTPKENAKKGNQSKGPIQENASVKGEKVSGILLSTPSSNPHAQFVQLQPFGNTESSNKTPSGAVAIPTSSLPDLNTSALNNNSSPSGTFRQPFTDLQQVQLRAQIFVYGSLIQGTAPDEACMVSAFGPSGDGGRSTWEPIWRVAIERVRNQKSNLIAAETPSRSQSGARTSETVKQGSHLSKVLATSVSRVSSKDTPAAILNPLIPISSPLWNISTPSRDSLTSNKGPVVDFQQAVTPAHSYQTPPIRNFVGHTSWPSQTCFPGPWLASPQTAAFTSSVRFHPVDMTETVKLTPVKDASAVLTPSVKHTTSSPAVRTESSSPALGGVPPFSDPKMIASTEQHSIDSKPRKRKKVPASDSGPAVLVSGAQPDAVVTSDVATLPTSPVSVSALGCRASDAILSKPAADASRVSSIAHSKKADPSTGKAAACSEETLSKVAEAKSEAEDAADLATVAVNQCEDLWSQLAGQKDSGLTLEAEAKLASAAVAIAAAASVAKAAAAAAKIACNAALQAKLMAGEAFLTNKTSGVIPSGGKSPNDVHDIGNVTPSSILKTNNVTNQSSSILVAAKEAAKRRVEAASAASRQAENLDAIVKAAELAAAAVSQAGKIVAMGEPLPLNDLIEAGPQGYWKLPQSSAVLAEKGRDGNTEHSGVIRLEKDGEVSPSIPVDSVEKGGSRIVGVGNICTTDGPNGSLNACMSSSDDVMGSKHIDEKDFRTGIDQEASDPPKSERVAAEPDALQKTNNVTGERDEFCVDAEDDIKEGSLVEVYKPGIGLKSAWYSANVLKLENGKVYVCYNDLLSEEGSGNLQEWVILEGEGDKAPIIRAAQPSPASQFQQTRKRRRAALGDYAWSVGDKVDVWIDDCWWEGVVTEKNAKDETTLKVHIPAQGETSTVRAWNLRASRLWINGKWIWSSSSRPNTSEQSDTPQQKRQKLVVSPLATEAKYKDSNNLDQALRKPVQTKNLTLTTSERTFDVGKTTNDDNKRATRRPLRTNQQKEGSRVVFGVPKPTGKKRKFMEVSKHFPANKSNKSSEVNDSVKFAKYLMPQGQGAASRGWKVPSRNDSKEKRTIEPKPRVLSTRQAHRTLPQREKFRSTSAEEAENSMDHGTGVEDSVGHDEDASDKSTDHGSSACEEAAEAPLSSLLPHTLSTTSKKMSSLNVKSDRLNRGRIMPSGGKLSKIEEDKAYSANTSNSNLDVSEPRRSNRRIQPTHRLLEGLQSSMVIPKMPSVSHEKVRRNLPARGK